MSSNDRIAYLDATRGAAMFLVVFAHIETFGVFRCHADTILEQVFYSFMMPVFFFISGFVADGEGRQWGWKYFGGRILRQSAALLVPALVIGMTFSVLYHHVSPGAFFLNKMKYGYWFTISLWEMLLFTGVVRTFCAGAAGGRKVTAALVLSASLLLYATKVLPGVFSGRVADVLSLDYTFTYMQYFAAGLVVSIYKGHFEKIISSAWTLWGSLMTYVALFVLGRMAPEMALARPATTLIGLLQGYVGTVMMFCLVIRLSRLKWLDKALVYTGKNTMDVYMLHYFFIPPLVFLQAFLLNPWHFLPEFVLIGSLAVILIMICLLIGRLVRSSKILSIVLFGRWDNKTQSAQ